VLKQAIAATSIFGHENHNLGDLMRHSLIKSPKLWFSRWGKTAMPRSCPEYSKIDAAGSAGRIYF
jgi:hypothetical protein